MRSRIVMTMLAGTVLALPALAQTTTAPAGSRPQNAPATTQQNQNAAGSQTMSSGQSGTNIKYITQNRRDLWRASKLEGLNVYNQDNEKIGDINEVLVDRQGRVEAVVIGVGGFLGLGERSVAVPFEALQWQNQERTASAINVQNNTTTGAATSNNAARPTNATTAAPNNTSASTTNAAGQQAVNNTATMNSMDAPSATGAVGMSGRVADTAGDRMRDYPERAVLPNGSKEQLKNAPEFKYADQ